MRGTLKRGWAWGCGNDDCGAVLYCTEAMNPALVRCPACGEAGRETFALEHRDFVDLDEPGPIVVGVGLSLPAASRAVPSVPSATTACERCGLGHGARPERSVCESCGGWLKAVVTYQPSARPVPNDTASLSPARGDR